MKSSSVNQTYIYNSLFLLKTVSVADRQTQLVGTSIFYTVVPTYMLEVILLVDGHSMPYLDQYSTMPLMKTNTLLLQVDRVMQNALSLFKKETAH